MFCFSETINWHIYIRSHLSGPVHQIKRTAPEHYKYVLQSDLDTIQLSITDWQPKLAVDKCTTMHFERKNSATTYSFRNTNIILILSSCERDLGISVCSDLCWAEHIFKIVERTVCGLASHLCQQDVC